MVFTTARVIYDNMEIGVLESHIITRLTGLEYWGDLNLSHHEYETLKFRLHDAILNKSSGSGLAILRRYPVCTVTLAIFLMRYDYNDNFWGVFSDALGMDLWPADQGVVGDLFCQTIQRYHFCIAPTNDKRKYLNTLLIQMAAPPDCTLPDLFFAMQSETNTAFDPYLALEALTSWRAYILRKPLLDFFQRFRETRAIDLLVKTHEVMLAVDSGTTPDNPLAEMYVAWRSQISKSNQADSKVSQPIMRPYLTYEVDGRGLCMVLPRVQIEAEWVEEVRWSITAKNGYDLEGLNQVFGGEGGRYVAECCIAVKPAEKYTAKLFNAEVDERSLLSEDIPGIASETTLLFDADNHSLLHSTWIPEHGVVLLAGSNTSWQATDMLREKLYITSANGYTAWLLTPQTEHATLTCPLSDAENPTTLLMRSRAAMHLSGSTLFGLSPNFGMIPIFTELPRVTVTAKSCQNQNNLFLVFAGHKYALAGNENVPISLSDLMDGPSEYGKYSVRLYQMNHLIRFQEFYYLPDIKCDYDSDLSWELTRLRTKRFLNFALPEDVTLEFSNATCIQSSDELNVSFSAEVPLLTGVLSYRRDNLNLRINLQLPVLPCRLQVFDATSPDSCVGSSLAVEDFKDKTLVLQVQLFGGCASDEFAVSLQSSNGTEQQVPLALNRRKVASLSLAAFADTVSHIPLPARLSLYDLSHPESPMQFLSISETPAFPTRPLITSNRQYLGFSDSQRLPSVLELTRYDSSDSPIRIDCGAARLISKGNQRRLILPCVPLPDGIYTATAANAQPYGFQIGAPALSIQNNVFTVPQLRHTKPSDIHTPKAYIQQAVYDILHYAGKDSDLFSRSCCMTMQPDPTWRELLLDDTDLTELVALAEFAQLDQISHRMQLQIRHLMQRISQNLLTGSARWRLICRLMEMHCRPETFDLCRVQYGLVLFVASGSHEQRLDVSRTLVSYNRELSAMISLQMDPPIHEILQSNLDLFGGQDTVFSLLGVPDGTPAEKANLMRLSFLQEKPGNGVQITLCKELSGDMRLASEMIQVKGFHVSFNFQADKLANALYFDQSQYLYLYANWVRLMETLAQTDEGAFLKEQMLQAVKEGQKPLVAGLRHLRSSDSHWLAEPYARALYARQTENCMTASPSVLSYPRFFYLLGCAALLFCLDGSGLVSTSLVQIAERYLQHAVYIAPRIVQRDMFMASVYLYLKRKERSSWQ